MSTSALKIRLVHWWDLNGTPPRLDKLPPAGARGTIVRWPTIGEPTYGIDFGPPWGILEVQIGEASHERE